MIRAEDLTPSNYSRDSRDYQLICRLYNLVLNSVKMNVDTMDNNPFSKNVDLKLLSLITTTLGFETTHQYTSSDLYYICSSFIELLKNKGSKKALDDLVKLMLRSQGIDEIFIGVTVNSDTSTVTINIPANLSDVVLIEDVLDYILPAGFDYGILRVVGDDGYRETVVNTDNKIYKEAHSDEHLGVVTDVTNVHSGDEVYIPELYGESGDTYTLGDTYNGLTYDVVVVRPEEESEEESGD